MAGRAKGDVRKIRIARRLRAETAVTLKWIATELHMGTWTPVANRLSDNSEQPDNQPDLNLCQKYGATPLRVQRGRAQLKQMLDECCTFEFDRRGKVIDCTPRAKAGCDECGDQILKNSSREFLVKSAC